MKQFKSLAPNTAALLLSEDCDARKIVYMAQVPQVTISLYSLCTIIVALGDIVNLYIVQAVLTTLVKIIPAKVLIPGFVDALK